MYSTDLHSNDPSTPDIYTPSWRHLAPNQPFLASSEDMNSPTRTSLPPASDGSELDIPTRVCQQSNSTGSTMSVPRTRTNNAMPMSESTLPQALSTSPVMTAPCNDVFPREPSPPKSKSQQPPPQPTAIKHRKPITDYANLKWERDSGVRDYVHRKDTVNCEQCKAGIHNNMKDPDVPEGGIVLRYSRYQKEDTQIDPPPPSINGTTSKQPATLTILAPQYIRVDKPRKFFQKGRIFKTVWFEPFGEYSASTRARPAELAYHDSCPDYNDLGEKPYGRFRWFVVIRKHLHHSLCFAIVNGGAKSMAKNRARGENLAVLYSTSVPPPEPDPEEGIVFGPLAVIMEEGKQNISPLARLDCSRVYTVEDDLKVMKIGRLHPDFQPKLDEYYWKACFEEPVKTAQSSGN